MNEWIETCERILINRSTEDGYLVGNEIICYVQYFKRSRKTYIDGGTGFALDTS